MSFFKNTKIAALLITVCSGSAFAEPTLNDDDMAALERSRNLIQKTSEIDAPSWLRQYDAEAPIEQAPTGVRRWMPAAQQIGDDSKAFVKKTIQNVYGVVDKSHIRTVDMELRQDSPLEKGEELYYFVSFAQPESEIKEILAAASLVDARVILRGMRPGDLMVNQTAAAMYGLGKDIKPTPKVAIDSRLHKIFNISQAPAMVYRKGSQVVSVRGVASVKWFLEKAREAKETTSLGTVSTSYEIVERDVVEEIQSRAAAVDWDAKRRKAMNRYISQLPEFKLPTAVKDATYRIDPRVLFHKDVTAKDGTLLASKGQVVNPIDHFPGQSLTLFVFDGLSEPQRALVKREINNAQGKVGLMISRIDKEKGFQFISELSKEYRQQVYMLQQRMINRFQLRKLPAQIYIGNGQIIVKEYGIGTQEDALSEEKESEYKTKSVAHTESLHVNLTSSN